jgi:hypothetical protein
LLSTYSTKFSAVVEVVNSVVGEVASAYCLDRAQAVLHGERPEAAEERRTDVAEAAEVHQVSVPFDQAAAAFQTAPLPVVD